MEVSEHIESDSVYISDTGLYYLNWLISRIDYLSFMKDDIDWPFDIDISSFDYVRVNMHRSKKHKQTFRALFELMKIELRMLEEIQNNLDSPGDSKIVKLYISDYSALKISKGRNTVLFTQLMLDEYIEYLGWSYYKNVYFAEIEEEKKLIDELLVDYKNVYSEFVL
ncbi:hypothetical protein DGMP_37410 [Desulfomarina profundi]|uniref:Uncharacterized protein n=1 Tax=Desulfomarina profundi TaxID=2772557 RepID=A0A8D5JEW4_9BACT|nr:hypothetical protein DGMP_37410 [Desulfomarina profundi]